MTAFARNPDVAIVGAGVAGLSAAQSLKTAGLQPLVLEAANHTGGRCVTDTRTFSVPFDRGCSWLHSAAINPLARLAEQNCKTIHKTPWTWSRVMAKGQDLTHSQVAEYRRYQQAMWREINRQGTQPTDKVIADILPDGLWKDTARHSIAQMLSADADMTSAKDTFNYSDAEGDWMVEGGLGCFLQSLHREVEVCCNSPVTEVDYTGKRVKVTTPSGTIEADHVILTVSAAVLTAGHIRFVPGLPIEKRTAAENLPNGLLNKIGIEFDPAWHGASEGEMMDYHSGDTEFCSICFGMFGSGLATGFVAGRFADQLEKDGPEAATEYCLEALRAFFGNTITKHICKTDETAWRKNPFTMGSYSYAKPGHSDARMTLAEPIQEKIFFAGEATSSEAYSTVHGAFLSGRASAEAILKLQS